MLVRRFHPLPMFSRDDIVVTIGVVVGAIGGGADGRGGERVSVSDCAGARVGGGLRSVCASISMGRGGHTRRLGDLPDVIVPGESSRTGRSGSAGLAAICLQVTCEPATCIAEEFAISVFGLLQRRGKLSVMPEVFAARRAIAAGLYFLVTLGGR